VEATRLNAISLFAGLTDRELDAVASAASETTASEGQTLANQGDFGHALYVIEAGTARVSADGVPLRTLGPGDVFGEIAVLTSGRRTSSVVATSPMRLIVLFKRDIWELERSSPAAAERLRALIASRQATLA
jgi:CRP-like cAMP-binding protein